MLLRSHLRRLVRALNTLLSLRSFGGNGGVRLLGESPPILLFCELILIARNKPHTVINNSHACIIVGFDNRIGFVFD
jgi:hypothetical protein